MSNYEVNQQQPVNAPMSNTERLVRLVTPLPVTVTYDIGKALSEGKTMKEAVEVANNKDYETTEAIKKLVQENSKKTFASDMKTIFSGVVGGGIFGLVRKCLSSDNK
jgi:hypothetical protein